MSYSKYWATRYRKHPNNTNKDRVDVYYSFYKNSDFENYELHTRFYPRKIKVFDVIQEYIKENPDAGGVLDNVKKILFDKFIKYITNRSKYGEIWEAYTDDYEVELPYWRKYHRTKTETISKLREWYS